MEFLSSDRSTFARQVRLASNRKKGNDGLFFWAILLTTQVGLTAFSWTFCMYVFSQPEKAFNYGLLTRFEKLSPLRDFSPNTAPRGKFLTARDLYAQYHDYSARELRAASGLLRRQYVRNYRAIERVQYVRGSENFKNFGN
ncbi:MAG: hypothetical protein AAGJ31_11100 [Verrucomicrobiota bacterium]